jgi:hypothetical protein
MPPRVAPQVGERRAVATLLLTAGLAKFESCWYRIGDRTGLELSQPLSIKPLTKCARARVVTKRVVNGEFLRFVANQGSPLG